MLIWFCFLTGILFVSLRCSRIVSLLSKFWNLTRLSLVCFVVVVVVLFWGFSSKGLISVFHSYFFIVSSPPLSRFRVGWFLGLLLTGWFFFQISSSCSLGFPPHCLPLYLSTIHDRRITCLYLPLIFDSPTMCILLFEPSYFDNIFRDLPHYFFIGIYSFLLNTVFLPTNSKKLITFIWQFNFLCLSNLIVEFAMIPSFPQGLFLLLVEFRTLWLLLF